MVSSRMCVFSRLGVWIVVVAVSLTLTTSVTGRMMELTHLLNNKSQHFPLFKDFELESVLRGKQPSLGGKWLEANNLLLNEHTGTHVDAPAHMWETGIHMHQVQLENLIGPAIVISITEQAKTNQDYLLTQQDMLAFEEKNGRIPDGSIVLLETDGAKDYWNQTAYLGTETIDVLSSMHYPAFGGPVIEWLIEERNIKGIGIDRMSFDTGPNVYHLPAHKALLSHGKFGIENVNNLNKIPPIGATIFVAALPIEGGSGSPARVVAFWDTNLPLYGAASRLYPRLCAAVVAFVFVELLYT